MFDSVALMRADPVIVGVIYSFKNKYFYIKKQTLDLPDIEKEVKRLLRTDNEAYSVGVL